MSATNKKEIFINIQDVQKVSSIGKALSSPTRVEIINILMKSVMNISEIATKLSLPISSVAMHINLLRDAGIIQVNTIPGVRGSQKLCSLLVDFIHLDVFASLNNPEGGLKTYTYSMPIGNYFDFEINSPCGMASDKGFVGSGDTVYSFYDPDRTQAKILWFFSGWIEYRFPSFIFQDNRVESIKFSMELCSESPGYNILWPSDLIFELNSLRCATTTLPGDYGGRRGRLNPDWWPDRYTQYGDQYILTINESGTSINSQLISSVSLSDLRLEDKEYFSLRLAVYENEGNVGGVNIFGSSVGDYEHDIELEVVYRPRFS